MTSPASSIWTAPPKTLITRDGAVPLQNVTPIELKPKGFMVLIEMYAGESERSVKDDSGKEVAKLYLADQTREHQKYLAQVGKVIELGPDAYSDRDRFPSGPRCAVDDWVIIGRYAGAKVDVKVGKGTVEYRLMNDDEILGTISDPSAIKQYVG